MNSQELRVAPRPLRLWPGVAAAVLICLARFVLPVVWPDGFGAWLIGGLVGVVAILVWWLFFSRAPWSERVGAIALMIVGVFATLRVAHVSLAEAGQGRLLPIYAAPVLCFALVAAVVFSRRRSPAVRRMSIVAAILIACGLFTLLRTDGIISSGSQFTWRWTKTAEERLLARANDDPIASAPLAPPAAVSTPTPPDATKAPAAAAPAIVPPSSVTPTGAPPSPRPTESAPEWPGFRGPKRDGIVRAVRINTDWAASPPVQMWRRPIGPGWSSFAVHGDLLYTQEQRGDDEIVACYRVSTGEPVWRHRDRARFWESNGGAGPRATPTVSNGRVFAHGATGILNALDARTGAMVWSRNSSVDTGVENPGWGFASSPLVVNDVVVVAAAGRLAAYDVATGKPRWLGLEGGSGYSSPHFATLGGVDQILLLRGSRTISVAPADGTLLWEHVWSPGASIVQPALTADGDVLIPAADAMGGTGIRRVTVARASAGWTIEERWTSRGLKPYYSDFVIHKGHAYGFDGSILAGIDLQDGARKWKGGRYGSGQLVLLPDQDLLLVVSEEGELALVSATPDKFTELTRFPALDSKTWNHPVLIGDVLLVRNGEEMAAFRLPKAR